ncbi:DUF2855 family protein [Pseudonocardia broussonetiae]|uniref:DUF2855 family protein n=1 Tax=Pseudonocardia broussonetiae TaxID=2736640 RepID=A0A6M6JJB4_9PSEU|nr:DUF2855 family protein [Pseudonocardia broussonetiae]QJY48148.1 DUF2855 family protein [Pseudonocardia broussonetiae]
MFEARRDDPLHAVRVVDDVVEPPGPGEVLLAVERFGLSANNLTYALLGDALGHWAPFPASSPDWGRVPAWGHAVVVDGDPGLAAPGSRWSGYLPMAGHFSVRAERHDHRLRAVAPERAGLLPLYRDLSPLPARGGESREDVAVAVLTTSAAALLDDAVAELGPARVVLSSATSRTALTVALLLRRRGVAVAGITSPAHVGAAERAEVYDEVVDHDGVDALGPVRGTVYLDVAGRAATTAAVHAHLGPALLRSIAVGGSHRAAQAGAPPPPAPPGPPVERFTTAGRRVELVDRTGEDAVTALEERARSAIEDWASTHVRVTTTTGVDGVPEVWERLVRGRVEPLTAEVVVPGT